MIHSTLEIITYVCCTARDTTNEKTSRSSTLLYYLQQKEHVGEISPKVIWERSNDSYETNGRDPTSEMHAINLGHMTCGKVGKVC